MIYAIEVLNSNKTLLPNVTLGYRIADTCGKDTTGLAYTLDFIPQTTRRGSNESEPPPVVGVVGGGYSSVTKLTGLLLTMFEIPQVSYTATSDALSDKSIYAYQMRTIVPNQVIMRAIMDVVLYFDWSFISLLYMDDEYGNDGWKFIRHNADMHGICFGVVEKLNYSMNSGHFNRLATQLIENRKAKVVIVLSHRSSRNGPDLMEALRQLNSSAQFIFVAADGWAESAAELADVYDVAHGMLSVKPQKTSVQKFDEWFREQTWDKNKNNPWFRQYWEKHFRCSLSGADGMTSCSVGNTTMSDFASLDRTSLVIDAVNAFGFALDSYVTDHCPAVTGMELRKCVKGPMLLQYLTNVSFPGYSFEGLIRFDDKGDIRGKVSIENLKIVRGRYEFESVGEWDENGLVVNDNLIQWPVMTTLDTGTGSAPRSVCSLACPVGYFKLQLEVLCCWECRPCRQNEYLIANDTDCMACPMFTWSEVNHTSCYVIPADFLSWKNSESILIVLCDILGLVATVFTTAMFVKYRKAKLIKACSRELSTVMLIGIAISFLVVISFLAQPTDITCVLNIVGFNVSFTLIYAPLFARTNRIFRIFNLAKTAGNRKPRCISSAVQVVLVCVLISVQVTITFFFTESARF